MTPFDSTAHQAASQSQLQPQQRSLLSIRSAEGFAARGLTFWLQWLIAAFLKTPFMLFSRGTR